jgi:hypothetical protein
MIGRILYGTVAILSVTTTALLAEAPQGAKADANKMICRSFTDTGTRLGHYRACHSAQEWVELRRQTKQNVDRIQNARPFNDAN